VAAAIIRRIPTSCRADSSSLLLLLGALEHTAAAAMEAPTDAVAIR